MFKTLLSMMPSGLELMHNAYDWRERRWSCKRTINEMTRKRKLSKHDNQNISYRSMTVSCYICPCSMHITYFIDCPTHSILHKDLNLDLAMHYPLIKALWTQLRFVWWHQSLFHDLWYNRYKVQSFIVATYLIQHINFIQPIEIP